MTTDEIMTLADEFWSAGVEQTKTHEAGLGFDGFSVSIKRQAIRTAIEALQADAARYRWLRGRNDIQEVDPPGPYVVQEDRYGNVQFLSATEADEAIDAAMALDKP